MTAKITFFPTAEGGSIPMRSRLEARWAVFFSHSGFCWSYEPMTFRLSTGQPYTPDFYLPEVGWIEIKPTVGDAEKAEYKLRTFSKEKSRLIPTKMRREFYTICAPNPQFDVNRVHRWVPDPTDFEHMRDVYELFCSTAGRRRAKELGLHPVDFVKHCLAAARKHEFEALRHISEGVFSWRCAELGASFNRLGKAYAKGDHLPFSDVEIDRLTESLLTHN
jgi:hypothetical protein